MKKGLVFLLMATVIFLCLTPGISKAIVIDFEDLPYSPSDPAILLPDNYMGFYWRTFSYYNSDYYEAANSGIMAINNNAETTYIEFNSVVDFNGAYFTKYPPHVYSVTITGYYSGQKLYERVLTPDDLSAEPQYIQLDFNGITKITFYSPDAQFFMDDLDITPVSNQIPTSDCGDDQAVHDEVTLDGTGSSDPDGLIVSYEWALHHRTDSANDRAATGVDPTVYNLSPGFYDVCLTVTDDGGLADIDCGLLAAAGSCFCTTSTMHIESIHAGTYKGKYGKATVTVFDDCGNPVSGASVTGTFTFPDFSSETPSPVTTNNNGVAVILTATQVKKPSYEFCVNNVADALIYVPADNVETCESK